MNKLYNFLFFTKNAMIMEECSPVMMEKKPVNAAATVVLNMVEDICWKIKDKVPAEKQEEVILAFFKALGSAKNLEDLAAKAVKMISPKSMEEVEEKEVKDGEEDFVLDLYIE